MRATTDAGDVLDAEFEIEDEDGHLALIMKSMSGRAKHRPNGTNLQYNAALELLLSRLRDLGGVLESGFIDSTVARNAPEDERSILDGPVPLANVRDIFAFRKQLSAAQRKHSNRPGGGNNTRQIRLRLKVPGYTARDASRLAADLAQPAAQPSGPVRLPVATDVLAESLHFDLSWLQRMITLLQDRKQVIFYGPPGHRQDLPRTSACPPRRRTRRRASWCSSTRPTPTRTSSRATGPSTPTATVRRSSCSPVRCASWPTRRPTTRTARTS